MENPFVPRYDQHQEPHPRQISFEGERVRIVLDRFGLSQRIPEMIQRFQEKWNKPWLTFETFFELYPTFPVLLEAHSFYHVADHGRPADLFRSFDRTFFLERYRDVYARGQEEAQGRPIGMVFPFDGFQGGLVIHNGDLATAGTRMVHDLDGDEPPYRVVVEAFIPFVRYLARGGWSPETPRPARTRAQRRQRRPGAWVAPWMVRLLGCGPDTWVLAFLLQVLRSKSDHDRRLVRVWNGQRYVVLDRRELANRTGLSERQVKRATQSLRDRGFLSTETRQDRGQVQTHFLVDRAALRQARCGAEGA